MTSEFVKDLAQKLDQLKPASNRRRLFEEVIQKALNEGPPIDSSMTQVFVVADKVTGAPFIVQPLVSLAVFSAESTADDFAREQAGAVTVRAALVSSSDFEQLIRLRNEVADLRVDQQAVRALYDLPNEGDFYEQMADHLEYDTVDKVRLQNAVWNLLTETFYEEGLKNNGVAVKFLMRLHLLACEAGLPEYSKDNPIVAEALAALGDPATNSPESLAAAGRRREPIQESSREHGNEEA